MALPEQFGYGKVTGGFALGVGDTPDPGREPDAIAAEGTVTFRPQPARIVIPGERIVTPRVVECSLDAGGYLYLPSSVTPDSETGRVAPEDRGVFLVANDTPEASPQGWTYEVTVSLTGQSQWKFPIAVTTGSVQDISSLVPVDSSGGTPIIRGPAGEDGPRGPAGEDGLIQTIVPGAGIQVDATDPANPIVSTPDVNVLDFGAVGDGVTDDTAAIQAAIDSGKQIVLLPAGSYATSSTLTIGTDISILGAGAGSVRINYSGAGSAIGVVDAGVRTFRQVIRDVIVSGPGSGTSTIGLDLDSVSQASVENVIVNKFGTGVKVHSTIAGGGVYNRFYNVTARSCGTGFHIAQQGSNAATLTACRAGNNPVGVHIEGSNNTTLLACQIENSDTGLLIEAPTSNSADQNKAIACRFESNTTSWKIGSGVRDAAILFPSSFGSYAYIDGGIRTIHAGAGSATTSSDFASSSYTGSDGNWRYTRQVSGASQNPAFVVEDAVSGSGTPVTHQTVTERPGGFFYQGVRAGARYFDVTARGAVCAGDYSTANRPTPGMMADTRPGGMIFDTTLMQPIWWTGSAWVDANGTEA